MFGDTFEEREGSQKRVRAVFPCALLVRNCIGGYDLLYLMHHRASCTLDLIHVQPCACKMGWMCGGGICKLDMFMLEYD